MGDAYSQSDSVATTKQSWKTLELFGLATMVRIVLMYCLNMQTFFNKPEEDLKLMLIEAAEPPSEETLNS